MTGSGRVALLLRNELYSRGLLGTPDARRACTDRARLRGDQCFADLAARLGEADLRAGIAASRLRDGDQSRFVMGFGSLMTEFLVAPIGLNAEARMQICDLGALANLIVSYVDDMVDAGRPRASLLPAFALKMASSTYGRWALERGVAMASPVARLTARLVCEYFRRLDALAYAREHRWVHADVTRCIWKMYDDEARSPRELARLRGHARRQRKTALPLVVLGMPGWLISREAPRQQYCRHRRWLVKFGQFIRWVDDAADADADAKNGKANIVGRALARSGSRAAREESLVSLIGSRAASLWTEWESRVQPTCTHNLPEIRDVLPTVLGAWLGTDNQQRDKGEEPTQHCC